MNSVIRWILEKLKQYGHVPGIAAATILFAVSFANAGDYTYRDGLYWSNGQAYTRSVYRSWDGCRYYNAYRYEKADYKTTVNNITYQTPGWREILAKAAKEREEEQSFESALKALGMDYGNQYGAQGVATQSTAYSGSSIYGYPTAPYSQSLHVVNPVDMNVLVNRLANTGDNGTQLAAQVADSLKDLSASGLAIAAIDSQNRAEAEKIKALGTLVEAAKTRSVTQTTTQSGSVIGTVAPTPQLPQPGTVQASGVSIAKTKCGSCHGGESPAADILLDGSQPISQALASASIASASLKAGKMDERTAAMLGATVAMPKGDKPALSDDELDQLAAELRGWVQ